MMKILRWLNRIIPKKKIIIFNSYPDFSGNSLELYKYIINERVDIRDSYEIIWMLGKYSKYKKAISNKVDFETKILNKKSLLGIYKYLRAEYIISTHGYFSSIGTCKNQKHINLWHGMPFKRIGRMLEDKHTNGKSDVADYTISTSDIFQNIMSDSFGIEKEYVKVTGQPCNDLLFRNASNISKLNINKSDYNKIIIWMPTYRESIVGDIRVDGNINSFGVTSVLNEHFHEFSKILKSNNYLMIIKPHPMDAICKMDLSKLNNKHIKIIKNEDLEKKEVLLYELLGESDVLLTDYSSVFIDYLNINKPIAFVCDDMEEYFNTRGFSFDNPLDYLPGEIISNYKHFENYLDNMDDINQKWKEKRLKINRIFNTYSDDSNSKRVCDVFWGKKS